MNSAGRSPHEPLDHLVGLADSVADAMLDRTLPKSRWTHEGHLLACIALVRRHGAADALRIIRAAIPPYNEATGVANTATGGYHDTITVYFVWIVDRLLAEGLTTNEILFDPRVERHSMLIWWERDELMSPRARLAWLEPTLAGDGGPAPAECLQPEVLSV